jgi:site-specific recombinase XerD
MRAALRWPIGGHDTRSLQAYLGHKNIQHTVRYTELAPDRFKGFWKD